MKQQPSDSDLRRLILDTTRHLLVQEGYKNLSMRKIARAIGYSATSIYLHFENKDALFQALIEEGMDRLYGLFKAVEAEWKAEPAVCLESLCRCYVAFGLENQEYYEIMFMLHPERMARFPAEKYRRARRNLDIIAATLERGAAEARFVVESPRVSASAIWAALHGAVSLLNARRMDVRIDQEAFVEAVVGQTLRGFLRTPVPTEVSTF